MIVKERFVQKFYIFAVLLYSSVGLWAVPVNSYAMMEDEDHAEHMRVLNLASDEAATYISVKSGAWEDSATWGGNAPDDGARVIIAEGHEVEVRSKLEPAIRTLRVDGKLSFDPAQDTEITFDTLVVNMSGTLEIGSEGQPIQNNKTARLIVSDYQSEGFEVSDPLSPDYDPAKLGLGIISMGAVQMFGQEKTPFVSIGELVQGTTAIMLDETPDGWKAGDKIVITNGYGKHENEEVRSIGSIEGISGDVLTLNEPLAYEHVVSKSLMTAPTFDMHVLNMERNIKIETTESGRAGTPTTSTSRSDRGKETFENRGHIMLMGSENVSINYVELGHLGRSSKQ
ncbi:MAG: G8 domain-containing protein, partial [Pseudomonadota bacterium]